MAFSLRKIISNITYFKTPEEEACKDRDDIQKSSRPQSTQISGDNTDFINFERIEPDSTSKQCATSLKLPVSVKNFATKKGSLSDTDLITLNVENNNKEKRRQKKMKLDIEKANQSFDGNDERENVENTPKHVLLECKSSEVFSERLKKFDFDKSFNIFDSMSDDLSSYDDDDIDIESLSDTDISAEDDKANIQMCRKVDTESQSDEENSAPSATPESFGDVEVDKNEDERISLLLNYQLRIEKMDCVLKKLLSEFQFHIEVSKIFQSKSIITTLPGTNISNIPKLLGDVTYFENLRTISPSGSWNIIVEKEDHVTKNKIKKQLSSMKRAIDEFTNTYLKEEPQKYKVSKIVSKNRKITLDVTRQKHIRISNKKKIKHFDFPDLRDAFINLFTDDNVTNITDLESDTSKCHCNCHQSITDSGLTSKSEDQSVLITSSIGNFSLDSTTLSAYSESLDQIISYCSFQDTSLYSTLLQKTAIERITFYVQVHSIQLKSEPNNEYESKNVITFYCPACLTTETEENGLLRHILSQTHCEKLHFSYKTAYIKKCVELGKEIQPSTVLNPMKMYRDDNKIVCFGDAMYACSLCFENLIVGESVLMAHCSDRDHIERREKLNDIFE